MKEELKKIKTIGNFWKTKTKSIHIYGVEGGVAQVKLAAQLLQGQLRKDPKSEEKTAVVLANEELMIPMINSIPSEVNKFNLTMSYPLRNQSGYDLTIRLLSMLESRVGKENPTKLLQLYYKHFTGFLLHPYIQKMLGKKNTNPSKSILHKIQAENISQIELSPSTYANFDGKLEPLIPLFEIISKTTNDPKSVLPMLIEFFQFLTPLLPS